MYESYLTNGKQLSFEKAQIMAIVNLTPDSFFDGGKFLTVTDVINDAQIKVNDGATILDLGAASSRPGADNVTIDEEIRRLKEPLITLRNHFPNTFISVDTMRSQVAEFAVNLGADIINDISGGEADLQMISTVAKLNVPYVLMHMQGLPQTMQHQPHYNNVVTDIETFFKSKIALCESLGFDKLLLDVGFGFGKTVEHNYQLLKQLQLFTNFGYPIMVGVSRKSMINKIIHTLPAAALNGTTVLHTIALQNGAKLLRVHDVKEAKQAIDLVEYYKTV